MIHVGFTGTREGMTTHQLNAVQMVLAILAAHEAITAHHGVCKGADTEFHNLCLPLTSLIEGHPSNLKGTQGKCPGLSTLHAPKDPLERNADIVYASGIMLAAPATDKEIQRSGTWATVRKTKNLMVPLLVFLPHLPPEAHNFTAHGFPLGRKLHKALNIPW